MIIKLSDYDGKYRIVSIAKDSHTKEMLLHDDLEMMLVNDHHVTFLPEGISVTVTENEYEMLNNRSNYDVLEIHENGNAFVYYDNDSVDNTLFITNRCNSNCIMCPTAEGARRCSDGYSVGELISIVKHIPDDAPHLTITGGEPFLIKTDLFRLLAILKERLPCTDFLLLTNGRAFCSKEYVKLFEQTSPSQMIVGIPIHGYNDATHDYIVQADGAFHQTFIGLKNLLAIDMPIELRIVVSKLNANFIIEIAELISQEFRGVSCVKIMGLEMTGNAAKNKDSVWIDYPSAFRHSQKAIDLLIKAGIDVGLYNFPLCSVDKRYWHICEKSISDYKIRYSSECEQCKVKDACGGIFAGTIKLAEKDIKPVEQL